MTAPTLPASPPRPGSRAARLALPRAVDALKDLAIDHGVCIRPIALRRTDLSTGQTELIDLPCGATLEAKCPPCATRARRLRQVQIREGWHRTDEPNPGPQPATEDQKALISLRAHFEYYRAAAERDAEWDQVTDLDEAITEVEEAIAAEGLRGRIAPPHGNGGDEQGDEDRPRRKRSTRRRQDVPELPRQKVQPRTVGRTYTGTDGRVHQPSMWLTLTLDSYGPVHSITAGRPCACRHRHTDDDPLLGTPINPNTYDYRRAAWDAVHFPRLLDRYWQNLRRAVGWNVQYAGCVEPQRRLAPHAHFAIRGTVARAMLEKVAAATYHQVWWPAADTIRYTPDQRPTWNGERETWVDPDTGRALPTWAEALDEVDDDPDAEPAHISRFGPQVKAKGVDPGARDVDRTIGYITKYVTKSAADCHAVTSDRQREHLDRFWAELRVTPCSERCANWLLYGVQPKKAHGRLRAGHCKGKVHQKTTLGIGGRRVLVSRDWSGKTLADHRADAHAWVKALLGVCDDTATVPSADARAATPPPFAWEMARHDDPDLPPLEHRLLRMVSQRIQRRGQLNAARRRANADPPDLTGSASMAAARAGERAGRVCSATRTGAGGVSGSTRTKARRGQGEDSIYQDGDRWRGAVSLGYGPDGKRQRKKVSGATRDEVVRKLRKLRDQLDAGLPPADDRLSVGDFLDRWLTVNLPGSIGPSTLDNYGDTVRLHLRPGLGRKKLTKLTVRECDQLWQAKRAAGYSSNSIRIMRTVLRKALGQAEREGLVPRNVAALSAPPRISAKEGRTLTLDQAQALLAAVRGERREALVTIMLAYGLRRGEALGLHWDRLDWAEGTIMVTHSVKRIKSHDDRPGARRTKLVVSELKTRKSKRTLYLTPELVELLRRHRAVQAEERAAAVEAWQDHGLVFPSEIGTPMDPDNFSHRFSALCKRAGLGHWHPHELRHSGALLMLAQGTELHVVSEVLGHTSIAITKDVYGHLLEAGRRSAAELMSRALFGAAGSQNGSQNAGGSHRAPTGLGEQRNGHEKSPSPRRYGW